MGMCRMTTCAKGANVFEEATVLLLKVLVRLLPPFVYSIQKCKYFLHFLMFIKISEKHVLLQTSVVHVLAIYLVGYLQIQK